MIARISGRPVQCETGLFREPGQFAALPYALEEQVVAGAEGESQRFLSILEEYQLAEDVTRKRLFFETLERVLADSNKIILESDAGSGVVPYLPIDQLMRNRPATAQSGTRLQGQENGQ